MAKVVIVGAGISGLALAYRLNQLAPAIEVTVLEQQSRSGGKVWTERRDGFQVEWGPNGFLDSKPSTLTLCRDLGLAADLLPASDDSSRNRYLFLDGQLKALPGSLRAFVFSDLLSWRGKLRFLAERWQRRRLDDSDESIDAFARRRAGAEVAEVFADALVTGIHAGDPALLSVRAAFPRLAALERQYGSIMKGMKESARERRREAAAKGQPYERPGKMWSLRPGLRQIIEALTAQLKQPPLLGVGVRRLEKQERWVVHGDGHDRWTADALVLACPAYEQARLLADVDAELAERLAGIAYNRIAVVAFGFHQSEVPHPLNGFGYIAPQRTRRDLLGVQWCSSIFPDRAPPGMVLLRSLCGGWHRPDLLDWDETRLVTALRAELRLALGIEAAPSFQQVIRWERAIPQYHVGHLERVAAIEEHARRHPGLFLAGNAYHGVALNDCTEQAEKLARQLGGLLT